MAAGEGELQDRRHAVIEQVIADDKSPALAHLPSGSFQANAAWLTLSAITHNVLRAAGSLAGVFHARATTATLRAHLINIPARAAYSARQLTLHLPLGWLVLVSEQFVAVTTAAGVVRFKGAGVALTRQWCRAVRNHSRVVLAAGPFACLGELMETASRNQLRVLAIAVEFTGDFW